MRMLLLPWSIFLNAWIHDFYERHLWALSEEWKWWASFLYWPNVLYSWCALLFRYKFLCQQSNRMQIYLATLDKSHLLLQFVSSVCEECSWWALCQEFLKCAIVCNKILLLFMAWASYTVCTQQATHFLQNVQLKGLSNETTVCQLGGTELFINFFSSFASLIYYHYQL